MDVGQRGEGRGTVSTSDISQPCNQSNFYCRLNISAERRRLN